MKDLIDERNFREMCSRSIVKSYNVHYMTKEEIEEKKLSGQKVDTNANEKEVSEKKSFSNAPSLVVKPLEIDNDDPVTREQIEQILGEREESFMESLMSVVHEQQIFMQDNHRQETVDSDASKQEIPEEICPEETVDV